MVFFQAEDGIRDYKVTGVQTCALPICSAAINYYFHGTGRSTVEGKVYQWKAGDLMLSAPGWAVHNHASYDDYVYELTVQDQPLNIAMESLLWQESLKLPMAVLGVEEGVGTNRATG